MTAPRSRQIDLQETPYYHIMSRCVRRAYLCGKDSMTGQDYSHRKTWVLKRLKYLASVFSIHICAYAIMSNHYHLVLYANQKVSKAWSHDEIFKRWKLLFPNNAKEFEAQIEAGLSDELIQKKYEYFRDRLTSISFFMQCLNQNIARMANQEDEVTGRFWDGRFKSQALLDQSSLLAAMTYVDLNPIRSKIALTPETSEFTSIYERIQYIDKHTKKSRNDKRPMPQPSSLMSFGRQNQAHVIPFDMMDYLRIVDASGRIIRSDKKGAIPDDLKPILERLSLSSARWGQMIDNLEKSFNFLIGRPKTLKAYKTNNENRRPKGIAAATFYFLN